MFKPILRWAGVAVLAAIPSFGATVGLDLSLLVDVSGSVDSTEFNLQKTGYVNAFSNAATSRRLDPDRQRRFGQRLRGSNQRDVASL